MQTQTIQLQSAAITYEKYGEGDVNLVIEIGLDASMAEWRRLAKNLAGRHTVLLYQRAGYGASSTSTLERTPENIAAELHLLLQQVGHDRTVTVLAHSQGGLYAWKFAKKYPELVDKLILLDPLSPEDYRFRVELTEEEFRKSGVDKTAGLRLNLCLTKMHLAGWYEEPCAPHRPSITIMAFQKRRSLKFSPGSGNRRPIKPRWRSMRRHMTGNSLRGFWIKNTS